MWTKRLVVIHFIELLCATEAPQAKDTSPSGPEVSLPLCRLLGTTLVDILCSDAIAAQSAWEPYDVARANVERFITLLFSGGLLLLTP